MSPLNADIIPADSLFLISPMGTTKVNMTVKSLDTGNRAIGAAFDPAYVTKAGAVQGTYANGLAWQCYTENVYVYHCTAYNRG